MSNRHELNLTLDQLRAALAKAERSLHLGQPVRSADLYSQAIEGVERLTADVRHAIDQIPPPSDGRS